MGWFWLVAELMQGHETGEGVCIPLKSSLGNILPLQSANFPRDEGAFWMLKCKQLLACDYVWRSCTFALILHLLVEFLQIAPRQELCWFESTELKQEMFSAQLLIILQTSLGQAACPQLLCEPPA